MDITSPTSWIAHACVVERAVDAACIMQASLFLMLLDARVFCVLSMQAMFILSSLQLPRACKLRLNVSYWLQAHLPAKCTKLVEGCMT